MAGSEYRRRRRGNEQNVEHLLQSSYIDHKSDVAKIMQAIVAKFSDTNFVPHSAILMSPLRSLIPVLRVLSHWVDELMNIRRMAI